jgi:hypothetical protein
MNRLPALLFLLYSCGSKQADLKGSGADTTQVIQLALKTVLTEPFPEMEGVKRKSSFGDTIFLTSSLIAADKLPAAVDSFHFKVLPDSSICATLKSDTATLELPDFLSLQEFQKTDSGYFVRFESVDCVPNPSRDGSVSLHILKTKDKFIFNHK